MAPFDEQVAAGFPAPHRDEPRDLRRDIADELADHVACALAQELKKTPDEAAARAAVLERFGDPARLARRLWLDWMKEAIMRDRVLMAGMILLALATLTMAAFGWMLFKDSRETNRVMLAALERMAAAPKESPAAAVSTDLATAKIHVLADTPGKEPVEGAEVTLAGDPFGDGSKGVDSRKLHAKTDRTGVAEFGPIHPGQYGLATHLPNGLADGSGPSMDLFGGRTAELTVLAPALPKAQVTVAPLDVPEDLRALGLGFEAEFWGSVHASDKSLWTIQLTLPFGPDGQPIAPDSAAAGQAAGGADKPLLCLPYRMRRLLVTLPTGLSKAKALAEPITDFRRKITWAPSSLGEAKVLEPKADGPNEWRIELPQVLVEQGRLAAADSKFLLETAILDPALAWALPAGRIVRLSPLEKAAAVNLELRPPVRSGPSGTSGNPYVTTSSKRGPQNSLVVSNVSIQLRSLLAWPAPPATDVLGSEGRRCFLALHASQADAPKEAGDLPREIQVWGLTADWQETSVTLPALPSTGPEVASTADYSAGLGWRLFDVTALVKAEAESQRRCPGVLLRFRDEISPSAPDTDLRRMEYVFDGRLALFDSRKSITVWLAPDYTRNAQGNFRPLLVIVEPDAPSTEGATPSPTATPPAQAAAEPAPVAPLTPVASEGVSTREQRLEQRKEELRALVEQRKAEAAAQMGGADRAK